eukprot:353500-Chlamydomonas_euryale.AAC.6
MALPNLRHRRASLNELASPRAQYLCSALQSAQRCKVFSAAKCSTLQSAADIQNAAVWEAHQFWQQSSVLSGAWIRGTLVRAREEK